MAEGVSDSNPNSARPDALILSYYGSRLRQAIWEALLVVKFFRRYIRVLAPADIIPAFIVRTHKFQFNS